MEILSLLGTLLSLNQTRSTQTFRKPHNNKQLPNRRHYAMMLSFRAPKLSISDNQESL